MGVKMRILIINETCGTGSHGKICVELAEKFRAEGNECYIGYGRHACVEEKYKDFSIRVGNDRDVKFHALITRIFDAHGFGSRIATKKFLKWVDKYNPELLLLHNIHGYFINVELLFKWIKRKPNLNVIWTLHDCWAFTGHCSHFMITNCEQWKTGCKKCPEKRHYPASLVLDRCRINYFRKKSLFTGVPNLKIVVPSQWMYEMVKMSYLKEYPIVLKYNKIDVSSFVYTPGSFRSKYKIETKKMLLGVAVDWIPEKGIYDIIRLSYLLDPIFCIVLVGITKKEYSKLEDSLNMISYAEENIHELIYESPLGVAIYPNVESMYSYLTKSKSLKVLDEHAEVICIPRTNSKKELAEIYSAADYLINPTHEDNYPTVNLEAIACGTFVITYDTGGAKETLYRKEMN